MSFPPMLPPLETEEEQLRGALAPRQTGGLVNFLRKAAPVLKPLFYGFAAGQTGDPMFGVRLEAMKAQQEAAQAEAQRMARKQAMRDELDELAAKNLERIRAAGPGTPEARGIAAETALAKGDYGTYEQLTRPQPAPKPTRGVPVIGADGKPTIVAPGEDIGRQPYSAPLVQIGEGGLNPYQTAQTRKAYIDAHRDESKPYADAAGRLKELDGILASLKGEPTPFQSEAAATAFAKGLKPAEAVMRDDIARILGQGWENQLKGFLNLPQKASRAQIQQMRQALAQIVAVAEMRQRGIDQKYQALGSDYRVEIPTYAPEPKPQTPAPAPGTLPPGWKLEPLP